MDKTRSTEQTDTPMLRRNLEWEISSTPRIRPVTYDTSSTRDTFLSRTTSISDEFLQSFQTDLLLQVRL